MRLITRPPGRRRWRRLLPRRAAGLAILLGLGTSVAVITSAAPAGAANPISPTYRTLTYDLQAPTPPPGTPGIDYPDVFSMTPAERAEKIAARIMLGDYDIVALSGVYDENVRAVLRNELTQPPTSAYLMPVSSMSVLGSGHDDSGLMLFSKFPVELVAPANQQTCFQGMNGQCSSAFHAYSASAGADAGRDKGIGYVKLRRQPNLPMVPETFIDVFITQLQNTEDACSNAGNPNLSCQAIRQQQVTEAVDFIKAWAPQAAQTPNTDLVLLGNLNIAAADAGQPTVEYVNQISVGGFATIGLQDAWQAYSSPQDPGFSYDPDQNSAATAHAAPKRVDYTLFRKLVNNDVKTCVLHQTLERMPFLHIVKTFPLFIGTDLSGHYAVAARLGKDSDKCSPKKAFLGGSDGTATTDLSYAGAHAWHRFNTPGTYSFSLSGTVPSKVTLFYATDLSTPIQPLEGSDVGPNEVKPLVVAPNGPFYVLVQATNPDSTGIAHLHFHRHRGVSLNDAIALDPFTDLPQDQMSAAAVPGPPMTKVFYRIQQHRLTSGAKQKLKFATFNQSAGLTPLRITLLRSDGMQFNPPQSSASPPGASHTTLALNPATSPVSGADQKLVFTVDRTACAPNCLGTYTVRWETDYTMVDLKRLRVVVQNDTFGDDEPKLIISLDGVEHTSVGMGEMDTDQIKHLPDDLQGLSFRSSLAVQLVELDDDFNGADDDYGTQSAAPPVGGQGAEGTLVWEGSGKYELEYEMTRTVDD